MVKIKLFCFPYAGGSSAIYSQWRKQFDSQKIELIPFELAGRGRRIHESLYENVAEMIEDVFQKIKPDLALGNYAFFGHSMGAMLCYELAQKIKKNDCPQPLHIFFSGRGAPHIERSIKKNYHRLPEDEFKQEVKKLGGTPPEFFDNEELMDLFMPMLKNDFMLAETAPVHVSIQPLSQDITVFLGNGEDLNDEQRYEWEKHTSGSCQILEFEGNHFFILDKVEPITLKIMDTLNVISQELY